VGATLNNSATIIMNLSKSKFIDNQTLIVEDPEGEQFKVNFLFPLAMDDLEGVAHYVAESFDRNFSYDKSEMVYFVLCDVQANLGLSFSSWSSDRLKERSRIGTRLKEIREKKGMEAKNIARLTGIDPSNLSKIESGRYSVGLDILSKIANAIGATVDIVEN
jgi:DNA-binding XRE family transcriptional regulator